MKLTPRKILRWGFVTVIWGGIFLILLCGYYALDLPDIQKVAEFEKRPSITLLDKNQRVIARYGDLKGRTVRVETLPAHLVNAVLAIEDRRFYEHFGLDPRGFARAMWENVKAGHFVQGGSTITQQLAKNVFLTADRTIKRKIQEAMLALWLEKKYNKDEILTAYLNRVYLGAGAYGMDAAARSYFDKPATAVDLQEAAILAGLLQAPSRYSPASNPDLAVKRGQTVLGAMHDVGFIDEAQSRTLDDFQIVSYTGAKSTEDARYFTSWVIDQIDDYVGTVDTDLVIETTLDVTLQRDAERRIETILAAESENRQVGQAALVAMNPEGGVLAMVGGRNYASSQFNRATQAQRQPGSAFKPIVYLAGLEAGLTPRSKMEDAPVEIGSYAPQNFANSYEGEVTLAFALAKSLNSVSVQIMQHTGISAVKSLARRLGILSELRSDMSLALGSSEVSLLELTGAYASFANGGYGIWPYGIVSIRDADGHVLYSRDAVAYAQVVEPDTVRELNNMLQGVVDFGTGRGAAFNRPAAGKTGTSQDFRDAWFIGFTPDLVTGVWYGNDDNTPMNGVTGGSLPALTWRDFMIAAYHGGQVKPRSPRDRFDRRTAGQSVGDTGVFSDLINRLSGRD